MEFKFSKDGDKNLHAEPAGEKNNQRAILVLLLLLVGGFSYVYFFTGVIKPQEAPKPPEATVTQVVKMPLPPRDGDAGKADSKPSDIKREAAASPKAEAPKSAQPAPVAVVAPAAKTSAHTPSSPEEQTNKTAPAVSAVKKSVVAEKKPEPAKTDVKKVSAVVATKPKTSLKPEKSVKAAAGSTAPAGAWSILVGTYVLEDALSTDMGRVRKAGFVPKVKPGARKMSTMNRLFLSEFTDRSAAQAALSKLKRHTSDAFILDHAGKHTVYAGSYLLDARAASEIERLGAAGFPVSLKRAEIAIPSQSLILGPFNSKKTADAVLSKLKIAGVKATLSRR